MYPQQVGQKEEDITCVLSAPYIPGRSIDLFLDAGVPLPRTHIYFSEGR